MNIHKFEVDFLNKYDIVISLDEAGRGPWAGPVTIGAILFNSEDLESIVNLSSLNDSKKVSEKKRFILEKKILEIIKYSEISDVDVETIDRINILEATKLGIINCLDKLLNNLQLDSINFSSIGILIDGKFNNLETLVNQLASFQNKTFEIKTVIDGDALCPSISAASILAKEHRDKIMREIHKQFPEYGFDKHKGYGTKLHQDRLKLFGPTILHRKSFKPIKEMLIASILNN